MVKFATVFLDVSGYIHLLSQLERIQTGLERNLKSGFDCAFWPAKAKQTFTQ